MYSRRSSVWCKDTASLRRYSRDDVYPQLQLQATLTSIVQAGWRPALAQHRGAQAPMVEPDEEKLPHLVPKQKFVKAPSPCNFRMILVAVRKCLWVGQPTSSMQFALIHLLSREHQLSKELRGDQCVGLGWTHICNLVINQSQVYLFVANMRAWKRGVWWNLDRLKHQHGIDLDRSNGPGWTIGMQTEVCRRSQIIDNYLGVTCMKKLHHRRPQTVAQIAHEILETSPEHGHTRPAGKQDGTKDRRQAGLGDEPRRRTQHPRPDGRLKLGDKTRDKKKTSPGGADTASQMKDKLRDKTKTKAGRQEKDKTREADRASQTRWETSGETRPETAQRGGHSIPAKMADKTGDKTADKRKTRPARRTQHPRPDGGQGGRQDRRQAQRGGHSIPVKADTLRKHWEPQQ